MKMSQHTLTGVRIQVGKAKFTTRDPDTGDPTGEEDGFILVITDPGDSAVYHVPFGEETKENIIKDLTGGVVPATMADLHAVKS